MRTTLLSVGAAGVLMLAVAAQGFAGDVNCGIVMKSVKMGRSAQDIADTMLISTADVDECKKKAEAAPKEGQPPNSEKPVVEKAPEAPAH